MALTALKRTTRFSAFQREWERKRPQALLDAKRTEAILRLTAINIDSEAAARSALQPLGKTRKKIAERVEVVSAGGLRQIQFDIPAFDTGDWTIARAWLQSWLPRIRAYDSSRPAERQAVLDEVNAALFATGGLQFQVGSRGLEFAASERASVLGTAAIAVVPFLIPEGWPPSRLGQCRYRNCGRWFLRPPPRRGSVAEYCSPAHASTERVMRFRDKARKAARNTK